MPEGPEVECVRLGLLEIQGERVVQFEHGLHNMWDQNHLEPELMVGQKISKIVRHGKYLRIELNDYIWVFHLGMSGVLLRQKAGETSFEVRKHTHFRIKLSSGDCLHYSDPRRFGYHSLHAQNESIARLIHLGPDALDSNWSGEQLYEKICKSERSLKVLLLDQSVVAGVGNIYASEICFACFLSPFVPGAQISLEKCKQIVRETQRILQASVDQRGTTFSDYRLTNGKGGEFQSFLQVFQKQGQPCPRCSSPILKKVEAGRSTFYCAQCIQQS